MGGRLSVEPRSPQWGLRSDSTRGSSTRTRDILGQPGWMGVPKGYRWTGNGGDVGNSGGTRGTLATSG